LAHPGFNRTPPQLNPNLPGASDCVRNNQYDRTDRPVHRRKLG
jgi:hypothetical protein